MLTDLLVGRALVIPVGNVCSFRVPARAAVGPALARSMALAALCVGGTNVRRFWRRSVSVNSGVGNPRNFGKVVVVYHMNAHAYVEIGGQQSYLFPVLAQDAILAGREPMLDMWRTLADIYDLS